MGHGLPLGPSHSALALVSTPVLGQGAALALGMALVIIVIVLKPLLSSFPPCPPPSQPELNDRSPHLQNWRE